MRGAMAPSAKFWKSLQYEQKSMFSAEKSRLKALAMSVGAVALLGSGLCAQTWEGGVDSYWDTAGNWNPSIPASGADVTIGIADANDITIRLATSRTVGTMAIDQDASVILESTNSSTLTLNAGLHQQNAGNINVILSLPTILGGTNVWRNDGPSSEVDAEGVVSGTSSLELRGAGGFHFAADNTYSGGLTINSTGYVATHMSGTNSYSALGRGKIVVGTNATITTILTNHDSSAVTLDNALELRGDIALKAEVSGSYFAIAPTGTNRLVVFGSRTIKLDSSEHHVYGPIAGSSSASLTVTSDTIANGLHLFNSATNSAPTFGNLTIDATVLVKPQGAGNSNSNSIPDGSLVDIKRGTLFIAAVDGTPTAETIGGLTSTNVSALVRFDADGRLTVSGTANTTFAGGLYGASGATLVKSGSGELHLNGANATNSVSALVNAGTLKISKTLALGNGNVTATNNGTLVLNANNVRNVTLSGGTAQITAIARESGTNLTFVRGLLDVRGTANNSLTVPDLGIITGDGWVSTNSSTLSLTNGSTIRPGVAGIGTINTGSVNFYGGTTQATSNQYDWEVASNGLTNDLISAPSGVITLPNTVGQQITVNIVYPGSWTHPTVPGDKWKIIDGSSVNNFATNRFRLVQTGWSSVGTWQVLDNSGLNGDIYLTFVPVPLPGAFSLGAVAVGSMLTLRRRRRPLGP